MRSTGSKIRNGPQQRETKSEMAASPLPSWRPKRGRKCYVTPPFSGIPNAKRGEQNQKWYPTKGNKIRSGCLRLHRQFCTVAILRTPPLSKPHRVGPWHGYLLGPVVHPTVRRAFFAMTSSTLRALNVEFITVPCMLPFCVHRRYVWHCANGECNLLPHWHALYWHSRWVTGVRLTSCL